MNCGNLVSNWAVPSMNFFYQFDHSSTSFWYWIFWPRCVLKLSNIARGIFLIVNKSKWKKSLFYCFCCYCEYAKKSCYIASISPVGTIYSKTLILRWYNNKLFLVALIPLVAGLLLRLLLRLRLRFQASINGFIFRNWKCILKIPEDFSSLTVLKLKTSESFYIFGGLEAVTPSLQNL